MECGQEDTADNQADGSLVRSEPGVRRKSGMFKGATEEFD
jgi:hypothetical protein